jgi:hypothetical protein
MSSRVRARGGFCLSFITFIQLHLFKSITILEYLFREIEASVLILEILRNGCECDFRHWVHDPLMCGAVAATSRKLTKGDIRASMYLYAVC